MTFIFEIFSPLSSKTSHCIVFIAFYKHIPVQQETSTGPPTSKNRMKTNQWIDFRRKPHHREGGYLFVHAGIRPGVPLEQQSREDLLWIRKDFLNCRDAHPYVVVHGHTPSRLPEMLDNRIGIDTGAFATGRLTCAVFEGADRRLLMVNGRPV